MPKRVSVWGMPGQLNSSEGCSVGWKPKYPPTHSFTRRLSTLEHRDIILLQAVVSDGSSVLKSVNIVPISTSVWSSSRNGFPFVGSIKYASSLSVRPTPVVENI